MKEINVAIAGNWAFHASDFVERNRKIPGCHMTAAWDSDPKGGREWAESLGMTFFEDYDQLLEDPGIDAVLITSATACHAEMSIRAARAHKPMLVEKAPMLTADEGRRVREAVKDSGVLYVFSDPVLKPENLQLKKMAQDGMFGEITMMSVRNAHDMALKNGLPDRFFNADESGGGVMLDLGCHGLHLLRWMLGDPVSCTAACGYMTDISRSSGVEDNASLTFKFKNGATGIAQSSWTSGGVSSGIELYGTKGCAHAFGGQVQYCLEDKVWHTIPAEELPEAGMKPMNMFLDTLINGTEHPEYNVDEAAELAVMIDMARKAAGR